MHRGKNRRMTAAAIAAVLTVSLLAAGCGSQAPQQSVPEPAQEAAVEEAAASETPAEEPAAEETAAEETAVEETAGEESAPAEEEAAEEAPGDGGEFAGEQEYTFERIVIEEPEGADAAMQNNVTAAAEKSLQEMDPAEVEAELSELNNDPFIPEDVERVIVGSDDRIPVGDPAAYPFSTICRMEVYFPCCGSWIEGTGFMVGPRLLVTAAHCMVCTDHHQLCAGATMYFGYRSPNSYLYRYDKGATVTYGTDFPGGYTYQNMGWDYAYLQLQEPVGNYVGYMGLEYLSDEALLGGPIQAAAYRNGTMMTMFGSTMYENENLFSTSTDFMPGNSGGPFFVGTADGFYIAGIGIAGNEYLQRNFVRRMTPALLGSLCYYKFK